jgi:hypothetical protein
VQDEIFLRQSRSPASGTPCFVLEYKPNHVGNKQRKNNLEELRAAQSIGPGPTLTAEITHCSPLVKAQVK